MTLSAVAFLQAHDGCSRHVNLYTVKLLIEAGSQIEAGSLIQAGYLIEAECHLVTRKDVIVLFQGNTNYKVPVNMFCSVRRMVTAVFCTLHIQKVYYRGMAS